MRSDRAVSALKVEIQKHGLGRNSYCHQVDFKENDVGRRGHLQLPLYLLHECRYLFSNVVKVLGLDLADVVLKNTLQDLLFLLFNNRSLHIFRLLPQVPVQVALKIGLFVYQGRVPVVLDGVIGAAKEYGGDSSPTILDGLVQDKENPVFFYTPQSFFQKRIQLIVPAFSALLACATWHQLSDLLPVLRAVLLNILQQLRVLLLIPRSLARLFRLQHLTVSLDCPCRNRLMMMIEINPPHISSFMD